MSSIIGPSIYKPFTNFCKPQTNTFSKPQYPYKLSSEKIAFRYNLISKYPQVYTLELMKQCKCMGFPIE